MPKKILVTGFKDSLSNSNIAINPEPISPINQNEPMKKDAETSTTPDSNPINKPGHSERSEAGSSSEQSTPKAPNKEQTNERKIKEKGYKLDVLTAYTYDLIQVDDNANKEELIKKLDDSISKKSGAIALLGGSFFSKSDNSKLDGLSINESINVEIKNQINTHSGNSPVGFFNNNGDRGIKVEHHGEKDSKKYLFKWRLVKTDGSFGAKVYEQIIDLS
ncbi:Hypothetical protein MAGb_6260 [Mycoplasmopsis agalactiae 14628]|uniref:Uncharacterized protein n=1 Tax=Mycoplasmopsis agalactiae 14628 TaxID=1110504 RepID=I5D5N9_MYCAA|nr:hypothetical protein [Mycoplasmopsis agalactiae]EIN14998.1 Hypothetical protein MAGb_6260 [Mycoplasmopsis agalactiae 14628]